jgi:hypothetical protein
MQHTHSRDDAFRMAREDITRHGRILMITEAILQARGVNTAALERRLLAESNNV